MYCHVGISHLHDFTSEPWRPTDNTVVTDEEDEPGIEVLPTLDGNILLNWTPVQNPLDSYRVEYREMSGDGNIETVFQASII